MERLGSEPTTFWLQTHGAWYCSTLVFASLTGSYFDAGDGGRLCPPPACQAADIRPIGWHRPRRTTGSQ
jgi:hypothetical protein